MVAVIEWSAQEPAGVEWGASELSAQGSADVNTDGLAWWVRSSDVAVVSDEVASWSDLSGNGVTATQAAPNRPDYEVSFLGFNGHPAVVSKGAASSSLNVTLDTLVGTDFTFVVVFDSAASTAPMYAWDANGGDRTIFALRSGDGIAPEPAFYNGAWQNTGTTATLEPQILVFRGEQASNKVEVFKNGVLIGSGTYPVKRRLKDGTLFPSTTDQTRFAEVLLYTRAVSATEQASLEVYLTERYKIGTFSPLYIPNLHLWPRADQGIVLNGTNVSAWVGSDEGRRTATRAVVLDQPAYIGSESSLNNRPTLSFDGVDQWLAYVYGVVATANTDHTFFFVVNGSNAGGAAQALFDTGNPRLLCYFNDPIRKEYSTLQQPGVSKWTTPASLASNGARYLTFVFDASATTFSIYENGVLTGTGSYPTGLTFVTTGAIGSDVAGNSNFKGLLPEMIHYDVLLLTADRKKIEQYIATRYNLPDPPP